VAALKALALFERVLAIDRTAPPPVRGSPRHLQLTSSTLRRPLPIHEATRLARRYAGAPGAGRSLVDALQRSPG
jgi:hypothetical protein